MKHLIMIMVLFVGCKNKIKWQEKFIIVHSHIPHDKTIPVLIVGTSILKDSVRDSYKFIASPEFIDSVISFAHKYASTFSLNPRLAVEITIINRKRESLYLIDYNQSRSFFFSIYNLEKRFNLFDVRQITHSIAYSVNVKLDDD